MWRVAEMSVLDLDSGTHHEDSRLAAAAGHADLVARRQADRAGRRIAPLTVRFREGTNQVQTILGEPGGDVK